MFKVVDIETTHLMPSNAEIISLCIITLDMSLNEVSRNVWHIRPRIWRKEYYGAVDIHGITKDECFRFSFLDNVFEDICEDLFEVEGSYFVCHANRTSNRTYDYACLKYMMMDKGRLFDLYKYLPVKNIISTHSLAKYLKIQSSLDLKSLHTQLNLGRFTHHNVEQDTQACKDIFLKLVKDVNIHDFLEHENYKTKEVLNEGSTKTSIRDSLKSKKQTKVNFKLH